MTPPCHNRPERVEAGRWVDTELQCPAGSWRPLYRAFDVSIGEVVVVRGRVDHARPIYRWRPAFADINACKAYDVPEGTTPAPVRDGWECSGCRWLPERAR